MISRYSPKQIEKYQRQKYISALTKCTKNLFKMFRDENLRLNNFKARFISLKEEIDKLSTLRLDSEHLKSTKEYIDTLYKKSIEDETFDQEALNSIKNSELSNLNRLQKMQNSKKYSKQKHREDFS